MEMPWLIIQVPCTKFQIDAILVLCSILIYFAK